MIRIAVVYFGKLKNQTKLRTLSQALMQGLKKSDTQVDLIDGIRDRDKRLTGYHFLALGCDVRSWLKGTLPPELMTWLAQAGALIGKKSMAFVLQSGWGTNATVLQLMRQMEKEGLFVRTSEILTTAEAAIEIGQVLKVD